MKQCIYCGKSANTREHIPARNLFSSTKDVSFVTVPSCLSCNQGFELDEEYFRNLLVSILYEKSTIATQLLDGSVGRSIKRKPNLGRKMFNQMSLVDVYSKSGILLGKKTGLQMTKDDHKRIFNVLDKYIKGLFYHHFKQVIPEKWGIEHHWLLPKFETIVVGTLKDMRWEHIKEDTFVYGFNSVPKTYQSAWCLIFYEQPIFYTFVIDENMRSKKETILKNKNNKTTGE